MSCPTKPHVLIIGAGLGGLALAHSLRKRGIPFTIFERDNAEGSRSQGWAISLHSWFQRDLLAAIPDDMPPLETVSTHQGLGIPAEGAIFNATTMEEKHRFGGTTDIQFIRADRGKLRAWLVNHLDVQWGKVFSHYEESETRLVAHFEDGSSCHGDVLIGADGVNSRVRQQLLPDPSVRPEHIPMGLIVGELEASREQYERWTKVAASMYIGYAGSRRFFVGSKAVAPDGESAQYYWLLGWADQAAMSDSFWTSKASKEDLHSFALSQLEGVREVFAEPIRATPVSGILHPPLRIRDMVPPELPKGKVSLLGDAVHPMSPFRGEGGNMAMKDSFVLASSLAEVDALDLNDRLKRYESEMIARTTKSVLASRAFGDPLQQQSGKA